MLHRKRNRALNLAVLALGFFGAVPAMAAVTPGGDTTVAGPNAIVGNTSVGTLDIDGGSWLHTGWDYIGYEAGSAGTAAVRACE